MKEKPRTEATCSSCGRNLILPVYEKKNFEVVCPICKAKTKFIFEKDAPLQQIVLKSVNFPIGFRKKTDIYEE